MRLDGSSRESTDAAAGMVRPAVVVADGGDCGGVRVRLVGRSGTGATVVARIALPFSYVPSEGDRVLIAIDEAEPYVIGLLHTARAPELRLADGARAELRDDALEVRDSSDRLLLRYADGEAELCAPRGDLTLHAPHGRVVLRSALDVEIDAQRDVTHRAGRKLGIHVGPSAEPQLEVQTKRTRLETDRLDIRAKASQATIGQATLVARHVATTAATLAQNVERYELTAKRLIQKSRDAFHEVSDLLQTRTGRLRTLVQDVAALYSRRTVMVSKQDTSIDGDRILLG